MKKAILIFAAVAMLLTGCAPAVKDTIAPLAAPAYPEMAPYPNESAYVDAKTGIFDHEAFDVVYDAWIEDRRAQYDQPPGYADSLEDHFRNSIPVLLDGSKDNAVCSPLNIYMALAMLAESTGGDSRAQILELLNADSVETLRTQAGHVWNAHYQADGSNALLLANSLWLDADIHYNIDTLQTLADNYYASVWQGVMGSPELNEALQGWLNDHTGGLLEEEAQNMQLDSQTVLALASTVYYRVKWDNGFDAGKNTDGSFHAPGGDVNVTYMNKTQIHGPYYWGSDFAAAKLRLADGGSMWLILPDEGLTPADILASGEALEMILTGAGENQKMIKVNLSVPKFDIAADTRLERKLEQLGIRDVFRRDTADLTPILPENEAWLGSADHAARVAIDEEGIIAAAYTVLQAPGAMPPPEDEVDLVLDRPFVFVITSRDDLPLFAGVVNQP